MHDGQNCFEAFVEDSFSGSWQADLAADQMIREGKMRECVIVGVSNGSKERLFEYMPDFARLPDFVLDSYYKAEEEPVTEASDETEGALVDLLDEEEPEELETSEVAEESGESELSEPPELSEIPEVSEVSEERREYTDEESVGRASATVAYYASDVAPFIASRYRVKSGRENRATCGSSMGGLMTMFFAWEAPSFARHHAAMSTSFWLTRTKDKELPWIKRLQQEEPRDIRLWLDSGTGDRGEHDDGMKDAILARDALLANGFVQGASFHYELAEGAQHHESAWAARLPRVLTFLFPPTLDW
jgi:predicted alpha/beta superfamily hydrolase